MSITNFEKSIEASNGYINSIKNNIGKDKMIKILELYPNLNLEWLLTGTGEMLKEITQNTGKGHNIVGNSNKIKPPQQINDCLVLLEKKEKQLDKILNLLNQKDEQINKLIDKLK